MFVHLGHRAGIIAPPIGEIAPNLLETCFTKNKYVIHFIQNHGPEAGAPFAHAHLLVS